MEEKCQQCGTKHKHPWGALSLYYSDLASGRVVPEDMRVEDLDFSVQISPTGQILDSSDPVMLVSNYNFALRQIAGYAMDPTVVGAAPGLISFNVKDQGRNYNCFKRPIKHQSVLGAQGGPHTVQWDGVFITVPGAQLEVEWTVDTQRWAALVGAYKEVGVQLIGDYVACAMRA